MRALCVHQPYAQLIALGIKAWETRPGPIPSTITPDTDVLICSTVKRPGYISEIGAYRVEDYYHHPRHVADCECDNGEIEPRCAARSVGEPRIWEVDTDRSDPLPLGHALAVCRLTESLPIVDGWSGEAGACPAIGRDHICLSPGDIEQVDRDNWVLANWLDQAPFGDWTPGRWAWRIEDVRPLARPIPVKGAQGFWTPTDAIVAAVREQLPAAASREGGE